VNTEQNRPLDLRRLLAVIRSRGWIIFALVLVASVGSYSLASRQPSIYQATAQVRLLNSNVANLFLNVNAGTDISRQVATESAVLRSNDMRLRVNETLGDRANLIGSVVISTIPDTDVLLIGITSTSPEVARDAANSYADIFVANRKASAVNTLVENSKELRAKANELNTTIDELDAQITANSGTDSDPLRVKRNGLASQRDDFNYRATQFDVQAAVLSGNVEIVDRALLPTVPVAPKPLGNAQIAAVAALLFGIALALILDLVDDRITSPENLESVTGGLPVLGSIPIYTPSKKRGARRLPHGPRSLVPLNSMQAEVYRTIRTNLRFSSLAKSKSVIVVTSSSGSEGKSTVTANLAVALAESGQRVVVVSGDLRRPVLSGIFGVDETSAGLTTVLIGEATVTECLVPITLESGHKLYVLPAGPLPPNPAELLGSRAMGDLLASLSAADVDFVLVDCPPVLPVSDPLAIAQFADGVIVLSVVGQTRAHNLREACDRLDRVGAEIIGILLNGVPTAGGRYPYHYDRRYNYRGYESIPPESNGKHASKKNGAGRHARKTGPIVVGAGELDDS
jgi:capsular exopolysaccharide synthesis family protein